MNNRRAEILSSIKPRSGDSFMSAKPQVFVTRLMPEAGLKLIQESCATEVWADPLPPPPAILREKIASCDGLVSLLTDRIDESLIDSAPRLKVISNLAVGVDNIDIKAASAHGIAIGNTPGVLTEATADMAFCLLIAAARCLGEGHQYIRGGLWKTWDPLAHRGQELEGKTLGVVGMGRIGYALARRCQGGWNMNILYHDVRPNERAEKDLAARKVNLDRLLCDSDFVSLHTDLNETTRGLIGGPQLRKMKPTAVLINTARGPLVVQKALTVALQSGTIFAAGLDVTDPEPISPDDVLLKLPNAIVTPHMASATFVARDRMAALCARNLMAGLTGQPLPAWANPEIAPNRRR
jgi:glyoxylate reductase